MKRLIAITLGFILLLSAGASLASKRTALVIGNDEYTHLPPLNNASRDARDMATKLKFLGFDVIVSFNGSERDMGKAIDQFADKLARGGTGLVFYAGHGIQSKGKNYMIPVDAELESEGDLRYAAIPVDRILESMRDAGNDLNIVIMDACRDNPLPKSSRSTSRGLAVVAAPDGAKGTAILYSAGPGQTAADGQKGRNGVFTGALLRHMDKPGWSLEQVFKATARDVLSKTNQKQRPWQQVSMQGDFFFREKPQDAIVVSDKVDDNGLTRGVDKETIKIIERNSGATDIALWQTVQNSTEPAMFQAYLNKFPNGTFAEVAKIKLRKLQQARLDTTDDNKTDQDQNKGTTQDVDQKKVDEPVIKLVDVNADYVVVRDANVRSLPNVSGARLTRLRTGEKVYVVSRTVDGKWFQITKDGEPFGYVYKTLLRSKLSIDQEKRRIEQARLDQQKDADRIRRNRLEADRLRREREEAERLRKKKDRERLALLKNPKLPAPITGNVTTKKAHDLGYKYYSGTGGYKRDYTKSAQYYYHAATRGARGAMQGLGYLYEKGLGVQKNMDDAFYWYKRSVDAGYSVAHANLGLMYEKAYGTQKNFNEAARLYRKGAKMGDHYSMNNLGSLHERGKGVSKSRSQAIYWYRKAADKGSSAAKRNLARLGASVSGGSSTTKTTNSGGSGSFGGMTTSKLLTIANNYYNGKNGYRKDHYQAFRRYQVAANRGNGLAQAWVGWMYRKGQGVSTNYSQAVYWYRKASKNGNSTATNNLGVMYEKGLGVRKSRSDALYWYRKAAGAGNARAKKNLRRLGH